MPNFTSITNLQIFRDLKVFLYLKAGVARGTVPDPRAEAQKLRRQVEAQQKQIIQRDKELARLRGKPEPGAEQGNYAIPPAFFVVGRGKSGTSWLMRILDSHPEILCKGEGRFFGLDWKREDLKVERAGVPPRTLHGAIRESEYLRLWIERSIWSRDGDPEEHLDQIARTAVDHFLMEKLSGSGKKMVGDKTPLLTPDVIKEMGRVYPEAKVIHIIRDGRDVTVSAVHHQWNQSKDQGGILNIRPAEAEKREAYRKDPRSVLEKGMFTEKALRGRARAWSNFVGGAVEDGREFLGDNYTEVKYESLLEDPEGEVKRLLEFLGAGADQETVHRCVEAASFESMTGGRERGEEDSTSFYRKGIAGDWKNVFTERDRQIFKEEAGELLSKLGYERDNG